jgi:hypothetical protein
VCHSDIPLSRDAAGRSKRSKGKPHDTGGNAKGVGLPGLPTMIWRPGFFADTLCLSVKSEMCFESEE